MPVVPATWEAEAGELLEPGRQRLQQAEIAPLHLQPGQQSEILSRKNFFKKRILQAYYPLFFPLGVGKTTDFSVTCDICHAQVWGSSPACSLLPLHSSMFYDEDGDLAHEFYEETIVTKNGQKRAKLRRVHKNLIPQVRGWAVVTEPTLSVWRWTQMGSVVMVGAFAGGSGRNKEASRSRGPELTLTSLCFHGRAS